MKTRYMLIASLALLTACRKAPETQNSKHTETLPAEQIKYARGFRITQGKDYTQLTVRNPWDSTQVLETYILIPKNQPLPPSLPEGKLVHTPVERVALCSSVHAGMWQMLGKINTVVAVAEPEYIKIPFITEGLKKGSIADVGLSTDINTEKLIAARPEILIISPYESSRTEGNARLGIVLVKDASYMEESPLGRAEWIKFEAAFNGQNKQADSIFRAIEKRYQHVRSLAAASPRRPTVFTERKTGDVWYIAGGKSYMGQFLQDAGAAYLWDELKQTGAAPLSFENVFAKAAEADFWLLKYNNARADMTYKDLQTEYNLYTNFKAFRSQQVYAINTSTKPYYEEGPMEPDVILSDLVHIFHPEVLPHYKPKYYLPLGR